MNTHGIQFGKHGAAGGKGGLTSKLTPHHAAHHAHRHHAAGTTYGKRFHAGTTRGPTETAAGAVARPADKAAEHDALVGRTEQWVAQTFYGTLLKQSHSSAFKDKLFGGGRGGETFGALLDQHMAEHMTRGAGGKLVDQIVYGIEHPKGAES